MLLDSLILLLQRNMPQLIFEQNSNVQPRIQRGLSNGTITFFPFNVGDSISFLTLNYRVNNSQASWTRTHSVGLYSLTGSSLSIENSISGSFSGTFNNPLFFTLTATSKAQNITPGTWFFGILVSTGGVSSHAIGGDFSNNPENAFPGSFIGGVMTDSTSALPSLMATSNLDITGLDAMFVPYILISG